MSEHTPTPWFKGRKLEIGPRPRTDDQSDGMLHPVAEVFGDNGEADAAFIVKAVNSYQDAQDLLVDIWFHLSETDDPTLRGIADRARALIPDPVGGSIDPG